MKKYYLLFTLLFLSLSTSVSASRKEILLNNDWSFRLSCQVQQHSERRVDLPHTWNAMDALSAKQDYYRGVGNYEKKLFVPSEWKGQRLFLRFEGVNTVADVFVNDVYIGEHRGGYGAFVFEITNNVNYNADNKILVRVNNALQLDVMPLVGDFNFYGGIYRDVYLIITDPECISLTDYASAGVYLVQKQVSKENANVQAKVVLSSKNTKKAEVRMQIFDGSKIIVEKSKNISLSGGELQDVLLDFSIAKPHLWNGCKDPFIYNVKVFLFVDNKEVDCVEQPLGLRFFSVDAERGFSLNGESLKLYGVCRHQDRPEIGNALRYQHHEEDVSIMREMGVNAIRLSHYPQADCFYNLLDKVGIIAWSEIPFVGPGGYKDRGFVNSPSFRDNGKEQLKELIRQHYNHPSVCFWGLFNELKTFGDNPIEYVTELNNLAHQEDSTRLTTSATFLEDGNDLNKITDVIAWNKYFGWYGGQPADMGLWADAVHAGFPQYKIAISEYGAGASIYHQQDSVKRGDASGWWHPENWQTYYHIENWKAISERPYIWGSFIWNMFDFGAAHRTEGDRPGINDKGIVSFDRKVKKDAFYFYKANWNKAEPFVYIAERRNTERRLSETDVMVFSNMSEIELFINGKSAGRIYADKNSTFIWKNIHLFIGENKIEARAVLKKNTYSISDSVKWVLR